VQEGRQRIKREIIHITQKILKRRKDNYDILPMDFCLLVINNHFLKQQLKERNDEEVRKHKGCLKDYFRDYSIIERGKNQ
jgi:hypothetical protein